MLKCRQIFYDLNTHLKILKYSAFWQEKSSEHFNNNCAVVLFIKKKSI